MKIEMNKPTPIEHEPKRNNRFVVEFPVEFGIESFLVQKVTRPKLLSTKVEVPRMDKTEFIGTNYRWADFEINLLDVVGPCSTSVSAMKMIDFCKKVELEQLGSRQLFVFTISMLDPTGIVVERWDVPVEELVSVDFGNCDYGDDGLQIIKIVLKPIDCVLS